MSPADPDALDSERGGQQPELRVDEHQSAADRRKFGHAEFGCERCEARLDGLDLALDALHQLGLVATADEQLGRTLGEQAVTAGLDTALVALGIEYPDGLGGDREMIDVGRRVRDLAVMQHLQVRAGATREATAELLLADRTGLPGQARTCCGSSDSARISPPRGVSRADLALVTLEPAEG